MIRNLVMAVLALTLFHAPSFAQNVPAPPTAGLKPGTKAPKLEGQLWLQKGKQVKALTAKATKGKVVVLEFFAYW